MRMYKQIEDAMNAKPTVVVSLYTGAYATAPSVPGYSAGVRGEEDWIIELAPCSAREVGELINDYPRDLHLLLNDDSVDQTTWAAAARAFEVDENNSLAEQAINALQSGDYGTAMQHVAALALRSGSVPTCNLDDITDFAQPGDEVLLHINGANWVAQA